ncbi:MAG TPA: GvpL/GvpF family gas vesicle protein [Rectinemataceae bacterium]|nr:GvpL/GvpF family gas vesicle protein [Rectinemataceae bacterium]
MNSPHDDGLAMGKPCCVYGVTEGKGLGRFSARGLQDEQVRIIRYEDLAALVSTVPPDGYPANRPNAITHMSVLQAAMRNCAVLPMRFGVVAPSAEAVRDLLLRDQSATLRNLLLRIAGKAELVLKVSWREQFLFQDIVSENQEIRDLRESILGQPEQESRPNRILLGQTVEYELRKKRERDALRILAALRPFACEIENGKIETDMMVLNAAFLVSEECRSGFEKAVTALHLESGKRLMFKYLGPLPPYSFVNIALEVDR